MKNKLKQIICLLLLAIPLSAYCKPELKFNNETFKIIQFTDIHWNTAPQFSVYNDSTLSLMAQLVKEEKPDFIVITGDIIVSTQAMQAWKTLSDFLQKLQVPFAVTFGNHDIETDATTTQVLEFLQKNPYNLTYNADNRISGVGNCALPIKSSKGKNNASVIYLLDSNAYTNNKITGYYDWIKSDQIDWYRKESEKYTQASGKILPSIAFFHIPFPEYETVRKQESTVGNTLEAAGSPVLNSGFLTSIVEKKDVLATFVGHEHNNDYIGVYANVCLGYGRKTGYVAAYEEVLERGARLIELYEGKEELKTYIRTANKKLFEYTFKR